MKQITLTAFSLRQFGGNSPVASGLILLWEDTGTMAQEFQTSRFPVGRAEGLDRRWLSTLIDAMEQAARPELRKAPCDAVVIAAVVAHLARPTPGFAHHGSAYSFRN